MRSDWRARIRNLRNSIECDGRQLVVGVVVVVVVVVVVIAVVDLTRVSWSFVDVKDEKDRARENGEH